MIDFICFLIFIALIRFALSQILFVTQIIVLFIAFILHSIENLKFKKNIKKADWYRIKKK